MPDDRMEEWQLYYLTRLWKLFTAQQTRFMAYKKKGSSFSPYIAICRVAWVCVDTFTRLHAALLTDLAPKYRQHEGCITMHQRMVDGDNYKRALNLLNGVDIDTQVIHSPSFTVHSMID